MAERGREKGDNEPRPASQPPRAPSPTRAQRRVLEDRLDTCSDDEDDDNDDERGVTHAEELREVIAYFHARVDRSVELLVFAPATNDTDELGVAREHSRNCQGG